ncbi:transmembrane emp24 domain-containing protein 7-like [Acanthaster planci]|uniref:Transmembrane emp24 domain-containing protein 7-like n=1 Tax=Acanthaster planci TaxID=133434 RepID=A0A8B7YC42_ACAPL|nr:transmembrane emp24 domain-containing protein 7-like [Acanthaster planci]
MGTHWLCLVILAAFAAMLDATELTFELPDNAKQCFYEEVEKGQKCTLEYQVVTGGKYDVDVILSDVNDKNVLYKERRKQYDTFTFTPKEKQVYKFCFSNEFSTFAHKVVYFDFMVGEEDLLRGIGAHATALTQLETTCVSIHENLKEIIDYQTHHRLREFTGRVRAEHLNQRVQWWSAGVFIVILIVGIGQVIVLRSFFTERRPTTGKI